MMSRILGCVATSGNTHQQHLFIDQVKLSHHRIGCNLYIDSAWKSSPKTGKRPRLDWTKTAKDQKFPGPSKTATVVQSSQGGGGTWFLHIRSQKELRHPRCTPPPLTPPKKEIFQVLMSKTSQSSKISHFLSFYM
jgi:hypothetical protein